MPWTELATAALPGGALALYRGEDGAYMIRANGLELMNGRCHRSEDFLGAMAGRLARRAASRARGRLLIGGLGLGFTAAAAARALGDGGDITVAEISPALITWYERYFAPMFFAERPTNLRIVGADVAMLLLETEPAAYNVIVLDVDNGPEALAAADNDYLYGPMGLRALASALAERGVLLIWSGFNARAFCRRAREAGFEVTCEKIALPDRPDLFHYIYRLDKPI